MNKTARRWITDICLAMRYHPAMWVIAPVASIYIGMVIVIAAVCALAR